MTTRTRPEPPTDAALVQTYRAGDERGATELVHRHAAALGRFLYGSGAGQALAGQLRPGVAANQDSVARLMEALLDVRQRYVESFRDEMKEMSAYLSPVQRAQFFLMRERLLDRVRAARQDALQGADRPRRLRP